MPQALPIISAVVGIAGTVASIGANKRAVKLQQQQQAAAARKARLKAIRQAQLLKGAAKASAASVGALDSSALQGGLASLGSNLGAEIGYQGYMSGLSQGISNALGRAATFGNIGQLGFTAFQNSGAIQNLFGSNNEGQ